MNHDRITINGKKVQATWPEGVTATMPVDQFVRELGAPVMNCGELILPHGVHTFSSTRSPSAPRHQY